MFKAFLEREQQHAGWRFWVLWVLLTNVAYFAGLGIERLLFGKINVYVALVLVGIAQGWALYRHLPDIWLTWTVGTAAGWAIGSASATLLLLPLVFSSMDPNSFIAIVLVGFWAGLIVGFPQWLVLRKHISQIGVWWIPLSSLAWGIFFPGALTGVALLLLLRNPTAPKETVS